MPMPTQIMVVAVAGMKMFIWHRRNTLTFEESAITCGVLGKFLLYLVGTFSRVFFWCAFDVLPCHEC
jgi:hypothetical protein